MTRLAAKQKSGAELKITLWAVTSELAAVASFVYVVIEA